LGKRCKVEGRKSWTKADKEFVLIKSNGRCCHCGKKLSIDDDFTFEHVIPLSKGGSNRHENIVALCKSCNYDKADCIVDPDRFYKYLSNEYLKEVEQLYRDYCDTYSYFNSQNLLSEDIITIDTVSQIVSSNLSYSRRKKCITGSHGAKVISKSFRKAIYSDLDDIYNYYLPSHKKEGVSTSTLKEWMSIVFLRGCFYILRNRVNDIVMVIPVLVCHSIYKDVSGNEYVPRVFIYRFSCKYTKPDYSILLVKFLLKLGGNVAKNLGIKDIEINAIGSTCEGTYMDVVKIDSSGYRVLGNLTLSVYLFDDVQERLRVSKTSSEWVNNTNLCVYDNDEVYSLENNKDETSSLRCKLGKIDTLTSTAIRDCVKSNVYLSEDFKTLEVR